MKKGMKKIVFGVAFVLIFMMASSVFAETVGLSGNVKGIVDNIMEKQGINASSIQSVEQVGLDNLPPQVDLKNIDTTNLAVYKVDYGGSKPVYVVTASGQPTAASTPTAQISKMLLNFGTNDEVNQSTFLDTATGVEGSLENGYVMMRDGSITGLSTNLDVVSGQGSVEIIVYINGQPAGFRNTIVGDSLGAKEDYATQSLGVVNFQKGDIISTYVKTDGNIVVKGIINLVEISTQ